MDAETRRSLIRSIRQRVESLARLGIDRVPLPRLPDPVARPRPSAGRSISAAAAAETSTVPSRSVLDVVPRPAAPPPPVPTPAPTRVETVASFFEDSGIDLPAIPAEDRAAALAALAAEVSTCVRCPILAETRTQTVFGTGSPTARLMFIGEAPGADEDRLGEPFIGKAGVLLTDMITKGMGLAREEVYIANILKCRPPENRNPLPPEIKSCLPYLERQIAIIRPEFLCILGKVGVSALLGTALPMGKLRGKWHRYKGIPTVVTWHPAYLLRTPSAKKEAWDDLQLLMQAMGLKVPGRKKPG